MIRRLAITDDYVTARGCDASNPLEKIHGDEC
jgi:hypothetical protein